MELSNEELQVFKQLISTEEGKKRFLELNKDFLKMIDVDIDIDKEIDDFINEQSAMLRGDIR